MDLGWVDFDLDVPPCCLAAQPVLPISHQPRQNQAEGGSAKIKFNPAQVRQEMDHLVHSASSPAKGKLDRFLDGQLCVIVSSMN